MRAGDAAAPFVSWATWAKLLNHMRLSSHARCTLPMASCDLGPFTEGLDKAAPLKRSGAMKETLAKAFPTPARPSAAALRRLQTFPRPPRNGQLRPKATLHDVASE